MNLVSRFERFVERLMERTFTRAAGSELQPVEIGKRLVRAMEADQKVSTDGILVPNVYEVFLSPRDYDEFKDAPLSLSRKLEAHLGKTARQRGFTMMSRPQVHLRPDQEIDAGDMMVESHHLDVEVPAQAVSQHTALLPQVEAVPVPVPQAREPQPELLLNGQTYAVLRSPTRLGRSPHNDIVVNDKRVSRDHAELIQRDGRWLIRDAGSTNGTAVNGKVLKEAMLKPGDVISLGGLEVTWRQ